MLTKKKEDREIKIICAWCKKIMGTKKAEGCREDSHGICNECYEKELRKLEK